MSTARITNPDFELGDTGWTKGANWTITNTNNLPQSGVWAARWDGGNGANTEIINVDKAPIQGGRSVSAQIYANVNGAGSSQGGVHIILVWYDASGNRIGDSAGSIVRGTGTQSVASTISTVAPTSARFMAIGARAYRNSNPRPFFVDSASWDYVYDRTAVLTSPQDGQQLTTNSIAQLRVEIGGTQPPITSVTYLQNGADLATVGVAPYGYNTSPLTNGTYAFRARVNLADGTNILTNISTVTITAAPPVPETREFRASNAYTYLVGENFSGLTSAMPPTARVLGVEIIMDYSMDVIVRAADIGVVDQSTANYNVAFDMVSGGTIEAVLMSKNGDSYTQLGNPLTTTIPIVANGFTLEEDGTSEGRRYSHLSSTSNSTATIGGDSERFGQDPEFGNIFNTRALGIRFYPNPSALPAYADSGDAVYRWFLNRLKLRVYFDAGSVEYYFASPDKSQVLKGELVHSYVESGAFQSGDAEGVLQLQPTLEIMNGTTRYIGDDWTIHSAYPPASDNQIGVVSARMSYNGLPTQQQIIDNRSRYQFITANFYGDVSLNSIYGAHGLPRAFAYNKQFFYKIYTQPDPTKDSPRHVAYHHGHLALGYERGNVDISVVGQPYNFDGALGASSWAIGDNVTGLLSLSGTILGVFAGKSIWGISGTTVDNFATQVISPKLGAVEYTITDMGFPVYANAYGIYTLGQTQEYGDYLGTPLSQDISPWLRPRLNRRGTSNKEVVAAWPVRSKNQYRLAFLDGYVVTMTTSGGAAPPTFSFRKYFKNPLPDVEVDSLYDYPAIIPIAVSSELDEAGEERVHVADYYTPEENSDPPFDPITIEGILPMARNSRTYLGTLDVEGVIGVGEVSLQSGTLPVGSELYYEGNTRRIVIEWGPTTDISAGPFNIGLRLVDSTGRSAVWTGTIEVNILPYAQFDPARAGPSITLSNERLTIEYDTNFDVPGSGVALNSTFGVVDTSSDKVMELVVEEATGPVGVGIVYASGLVYPNEGSHLSRTGSFVEFRGNGQPAAFTAGVGGGGNITPTVIWNIGDVIGLRFTTGLQSDSTDIYLRMYKNGTLVYTGPKGIIGDPQNPTTNAFVGVYAGDQFAGPNSFKVTVETDPAFFAYTYAGTDGFPA